MLFSQRAFIDSSGHRKQLEVRNFTVISRISSKTNQFRCSQGILNPSRWSALAWG